MYQFAYDDIQTDSVAEARDREYQVLSRSIELLDAARQAGSNSHEAVEAIHYLNRVWTALLEDLWLLREADELRQGRSDNWDGLIEVSAIIRDGMK
jgi:flagellar biosynthesis activator protein FlaF